MQESTTNDRNKDSDAGSAWWREAVGVFGEVTGWIVAPIIGALYAGRYLDERYGTENLYFLSLTALAFIISCIGIGIVGVKYIRRMEEESKHKQQNEQQRSIKRE